MHGAAGALVLGTLSCRPPSSSVPAVAEPQQEAVPSPSVTLPTDPDAAIASDVPSPAGSTPASPNSDPNADTPRLAVNPPPPTEDALIEDWGPMKEPMGLEIKNLCRHDVDLYLGPSFPEASIEPLTLAGDASIHMSVMPEGTVWLLDESRQALDEIPYSRGQERLVVERDCARLRLPDAR